MDNQYSKIEEIYKKTSNNEIIKKYIGSFELNIMSIALIFYIFLIIYLVTISINYAISAEVLLIIVGYFYISNIYVRASKEFEKDNDLKVLITNKIKYLFYEKNQTKCAQFVYFKYLLEKNKINTKTLEEYQDIFELKNNLNSNNSRNYDFFNTIVSGVVIGGYYFLLSLTYPLLLKENIGNLGIFTLIGLSTFLLIMVIYLSYGLYISSKEKKNTEVKKLNAYIKFLINTESVKQTV